MRNEIALGMTLPDGSLVKVGRIIRHVNSVYVEADDDLLPGASGYWPVGRLPEALADALPDSFGLRVIETATGSRPGTPLDALLLTSDRHRLGALRLLDKDGRIITGATSNENVDLDQVIKAAMHLDADRTLSRAVVALLAEVSGSAGGARPKVMLEHEGRPAMIKLPRHNDVRNIAIQEHDALARLHKSGGAVADNALLRLPGQRHHALISYRFDRTPQGRVPMISGRTAAALIDPRESGESNAAWESRVSHEHLALFLHEHGASPEADTLALYRLALANAACGNTDNHLKNHAFLWTPDGWRLAPAYDIVPQPDRLHHKLAFYIEGDTAVTALRDRKSMLAFGERLGIKREDALEIVEAVTEAWRGVNPVDEVSRELGDDRRHEESLGMR